MGAIEIMNEAALERMRRVCQLAADTLVMVGRRLEPGMTTDDINTLVHDYTVEHDAIPSPLNYKGYPKSVCTSVNEVVCHGIPGKRVLNEGDIINVDVTSYMPPTNGFHGDTSATFYVGTPTDTAKRVVEVSRHRRHRKWNFASCYYRRQSITIRCPKIHWRTYCEWLRRGPAWK